MKNLEHLPEKFAFKLDEIGKRWIKETFGSTKYNNCNGYFHYPNYMNNNGFYNGYHRDSELKKDYTLISTSQLFPQPQIPTIEKGVMMLVWDVNEENAPEREVMFYHPKKGYYETRGLFWKHAKPIPHIPEYTIEEAEKKFNIKIKK